MKKLLLILAGLLMLILAGCRGYFDGLEGATTTSPS